MLEAGCVSGRIGVSESENKWVKGLVTLKAHASRGSRAFVGGLGGAARAAAAVRTDPQRKYTPKESHGQRLGGGKDIGYCAACGDAGGGTRGRSAGEGSWRWIGGGEGTRVG